MSDKQPTEIPGIYGVQGQPQLQFAWDVTEVRRDVEPGMPVIVWCDRDENCWRVLFDDRLKTVMNDWNSRPKGPFPTVYDAVIAAEMWIKAHKDSS